MNIKEAIEEMKSLSPSETAIETILDELYKQKYNLDEADCLIKVYEDRFNKIQEILSTKDPYIIQYRLNKLMEGENK